MTAKKQDKVQSVWSRTGIDINSITPLVVTLLIAGCGGVKPRVGDLAVFPVRGTVTYEGEPLAAAVVTLVPIDETKTQPSSQGVTDDLGEFSLSTYNVNDGAPTGDFRVTVSCENKDVPKINGEYPELLPVRYQSVINSGLKAKIEDGDNDLPPFELKKK